MSRWVAPLLLLSVSGHAASPLEQLFPEGVPGTTDAPGVTVQSRTHPQTDPLGIRWGDALLFPRASEALGYESNVTGQSHAAGTVVVRTGASLRLVDQPSDGRLDAVLAVQDLRTPDQPRQGTTTWDAALAGHHDFGDDRLSVGLFHRSLAQTPRDLDTPALAAPVLYSLDGVRTGYQSVHGRVSLEQALEVDDWRYGHGNVAGRLFRLSYLDRAVVQPELTIRYDLAPLSSLVVELRGAVSRYDQAPSGLPRRNSSGETVLAGIDLGVAGPWRARALLGYQRRDFDSPVYGRAAAPVAELLLTWQPTALTTVGATVLRRIDDAVDPTIASTVLTEADLRIDHELTRDIVLQGRAGMQLAGDTHGGGHSLLSGAGLGVDWRLDRHIGIGASYDASVRSAARPNDFVDHVVLLRVTFGL